jgi:cellulose synthase/poly-beta-1,6-N-acetylglucosamine synthase-like glycosyltransferase
MYDTWLIAYVALALRAKRFEMREASVPALHTPGPSVAVVISARNELLSLPATLDALLTQQDPAEEIWLVDDGSDDGTTSLLSQRYGVDVTAAAGRARSTLHPCLHVISKPTSGKADSLNLGIGSSCSELVITLDADTVLRSDAVGAMRRAFADDSQLVVAGGVLTPKCTAGFSGKIFEWFQTYEYIRAFIARVAWMRANALLLVSGAFACYRRSALDRVGGFNTHSWVEDYELTHRLHRFAHEHDLQWRVGVLPDAAAITDVPGNLKAFLRQRRRWFAGFLQTLFSYRDMIANSRYASVGRFMLPLKVIDTLQPLFGITAFLLLVAFVLRGGAVLTPVWIVIAVKLVIDFVFLFWGVSFYNRWSGRSWTPRQWLLTGLAALTEPFFFQLLRHSGAMLGWFAVMTQRVDWLPQRSASRVLPVSMET